MLIFVPYHVYFILREIRKLNKVIEDEYMRLAVRQRRPPAYVHENRFKKWLGINYLTGKDTEKLHSATAFVEFHTLTAKQQAIQCTLLGTSKCM